MLKESTFDDSLLGFNENTEESEYDYFISKINSDLDSGKVYFLKIAFGDEIAGMSILCPNQTSNCNHIVDITKGFIKKKFRGKEGVKGAFSSMVEKCNPLKHTLFILDVRENSRAHALWKSFGFKEYGRLENYSLIDGTYHAGSYMQQTLSDLQRVLGE